ncbi:hypothetical protein BJV74DRAFT_799846 [Russula compacta]|nr:hypothetical protein BJV74DRAFT_799846 [Russula compacta]
MSSEQQVSLADVPALLEGHHSEVTDEVSKKDTVHVFAITGAPTFGTLGKKWDFHIEFSFLGVVWILKGWIDLTTLAISATLSVRIPIIGTHQIASVNGNLQNGVTVTFGIPGILSGSAKFYAKNKWLYVDLSVTVFGKKGSITIKLIPIP